MEPTVSDAEIDALLAALDLKDETRTGWDLRGIDDPESVAAHTWGVAYLCLLYADRAGTEAGQDGPVDRDRALRMAVLHDVAEAETGDVPTRADSTAETPDPETKERRERAALAELVAPFTGGDGDEGGNSDEADDEGGNGDEADDADLRTLWEEYEARETPTARFVKDMDLVDMCLQALCYEREGRYEPGESGAFEEYDRLDEFFATAEPRLGTEIGRELFAAIHERYEAAKRGETRREE